MCILADLAYKRAPDRIVLGLNMIWIHACFVSWPDHRLCWWPVEARVVWRGEGSINKAVKKWCG